MTENTPNRIGKTPQEKKALSLKKDRRENFGRNDKASRKLVPLRKAQAQRRLRRADKQSIETAIFDPDAEMQLPLERGKPDFIKYPGEVLEDAIVQNALAALKREGRKSRTRAEEIAWYERFHGPAVAARLRRFYLKMGWIEE